MKVIEIRDQFGVDALKLVERPALVPGPAQVVLKMKSFSINYRDLLVVNGAGRWKPPLPFTTRRRPTGQRLSLS
jgi:NADPH:quinone reductase-like Zn-dependent oxidoreductase